MTDQPTPIRDHTDDEPTYSLELTTDELIELRKAIGISVDVKLRRMARLNPNTGGYSSEARQLRTMQNASDTIVDALTDALAA